jgi:hypothetical protein
MLVEKITLESPDSGFPNHDTFDICGLLAVVKYKTLVISLGGALLGV